MQLAKCIVGFPQGLDDFVSLFPGFFTPNLSFSILGTHVRSKSFVESFMANILHEDLGMVFNPPLLTNL